MIELLVYAAIAVVVLVVIAGALTRVKSSTKLFYVRRKALFSRAERSFLGVLDQAVGGDFRVFGKVRISDVVTTAKGLDGKTRMSHLGKIHQKHFDFVLCDPKSLEIVAAIELNDSSHRSKTRTQRDTFVRRVCETAGLPLLEFSAKRSYVLSELRSSIEGLSAAETDAA